MFDVSQSTSPGASLNDILAKSKSNMNKLVEIRWYSHEIGFHIYIKKMYDSVQLKEEHWCFQQHIWRNDLHKKKIPDENVIKTLINGVKSSENQSERGLHETERISSDEYAEVNDIVQKDIYIYI